MPLLQAGAVIDDVAGSGRGSRRAAPTSSRCRRAPCRRAGWLCVDGSRVTWMPVSSQVAAVLTKTAPPESPVATWHSCCVVPPDALKSAVKKHVSAPAGDLDRDVLHLVGSPPHGSSRPPVPPVQVRDRHPSRDRIAPVAARRRSSRPPPPAGPSRWVRGGKPGIALDPEEHQVGGSSRRSGAAPRSPGPLDRVTPSMSTSPARTWSAVRTQPSPM